MPPPGYSRDRPHCFVVTLPLGSTWFFQCGTPDLVSEWVSTCNYWSARLSREPLMGGVSNVEYGWNKVETNYQLDDDDDDGDEYRGGGGGTGKGSSSVKSGKSGHSRISTYAGSTFNGGGTIGGGGGGTMNDRMRIEDWRPPNVPMTPSQLSEEVQLEHLKRHVELLQHELQTHQELRAPMLRLVRPLFSFLCFPFPALTPPSRVEFSTLLEVRIIRKLCRTGKRSLNTC
jgi:hypothetical protein